MPPSIYDYVKKEENSFETEEIQVGENWMWNFRKHVQLIFHLKNGVFYTGENNWLRAFKNIMEPILNLSYWTEDLEVKDVAFFIEEARGRVLSFLVKKYHDEVYTRKHDLDKLFDDITESDLDYGGALVQKGPEMPEVLPLNSIAFCDQTDIMGGTLGFKFYFSPSKLKSMSKLGWGDVKNGATLSIDELCVLAEATKDPIGTQNKKTNRVPSKSIELYIVRGNMPYAYLYDDNNMEESCNQVQIIAYYTDKDHNKIGVTLYRKEDDGESLKFFTSKEIYGRALGRGQGEMLLHPQIWTNFLTIHKTNMLEAGSKVPLYTDDPAYTQKNKIQDMENLEITTIEDGKRIFQVPTVAPANVQLLEKSVDEWYQQGQLAGSAFDPLIGQEQSSGTTFRGQERSVAQGRGLHDRRRGQRAKFIEEIYRDWIISDIVKEINKGQEFISSLSTEELTWVKDQVTEYTLSQRVFDLVINQGKIVSPDDLNTLRDVIKQEFSKNGNKHLLEILKGEFDGIEVKMGINIAGKQKNISAMSDKILSIFQQAFANPQAFLQTMQIPAMAKGFETILEYGGLNISDFSSLLQTPPMQNLPTQQPSQQGQSQQLPVQAPQQVTAQTNG